MEFNSLDAQRESCHDYIASQKGEGWISLRDDYDDGGFSGGNLERPALKRLLNDIEAGLVDVVVVYKIDRLSRSMLDFLKLVEAFDQHGVTFVSITQSFSTTTSMGRLMLNVMLSFAQFERELTGERIRDKVAASRKKGIWMGGPVPFGYRVENRKLVIRKDEAMVVRNVFERFVTVRSAVLAAQQLNAEGVISRKGTPFDKGALYKMLNNRVYIGEAVHKTESYPGEHEAIVSKDLWDSVHTILQESPRARASKTRTQMPALLKGVIFGPNGGAMTPTHSRRRGKLYRYYVSMSVLNWEREPAQSGEFQQQKSRLSSSISFARRSAHQKLSSRLGSLRERLVRPSPRWKCGTHCSSSIVFGISSFPRNRRTLFICWWRGCPSQRMVQR